MKRQPPGIPVGGQFSADRKEEPAGNLTGWATGEEAAPSLAEREEVFLAEIRDRIGPGAVPENQARLDACRTDAGRSLMLDSMENPWSRYDMNTDEPDALAEMGYESYGQVAPLGARTILGAGIDPERAAVLSTPEGAKLFRTTHLSELTAEKKTWSAEAIMGLTPQELADVAANQGDGYLINSYKALISKNHPEREAAFDKAASHNVHWDAALVESEYPVEDLGAINKALGRDSSAWRVLRMARDGHTEQTLKDFGAKVCGIATAGNLDAMGISPKAARSFVSRGGVRTAGDMNEYHRAGFTTGRQIQLLDNVADVDASIAMKGKMLKAVDPEDLLKWQSQTYSTRFNLSEVRTVAALQKSGFPDPSAFDDKYRPHVHTQVDRSYAGSGNSSPIESMGAFVGAKISAEQAGRLSRAGIPIGMMPDFKDSKDLWADGAPYRERYASSYQATPWAFNKDNWEQGS